MKNRLRLAGIALCLLLATPHMVMAAKSEDSSSESNSGRSYSITVNDEDSSSEDDYGVIIDKDQETPKGKQGDKVDVTLTLTNLDDEEVTDVIVKAKTSAKSSSYPFEITKTNSYKKIKKIAGGASKEVVFSNRKIRSDAEVGYNQVDYTITYKKNGKTYKKTQSIYVNVEASESSDGGTVDNSSSEGTDNNSSSDGDSDYVGYIDDSSSSSDDSSDGDSESKGTTPRVIIEKFTTDPESVKAGETFKIVLQLRNTSKKTDVSNMMLTFQTPDASDSSSSSSSSAESSGDAFLPVNGSDTIFVDSIAKNSSQEVSIEMTAGADLTQGTYPVEIALKYEDSSANSFEESLHISVPVHQDARFETSTPTVSPSDIAVGDETNVTFEIYNLGKTKLYNVKVKTDDPSLEETSSFIGNIDTGGTGSVDMMVTGKEVSSGDGTCKLIISYEDQDGNESTYETSCNIYVSDELVDESDLESYDAEMDAEAESGQGISVLQWIGIGIGIIGVIIVIVLLIIRRKHKKEREWQDEILGSDGDELR